jgi:hypothetical protein
LLISIQIALCLYKKKICFIHFTKYMLENTEMAIKNGQSRQTDSIVYTG